VKTKQPPKAKKGKLDRKEWDFRKIPKSEIETCFIYEYSRELARRSPRILALFAQWQAGRRAGERTPQSSKGTEAYKEFRKMMTACFPDFPDINEDWFPDTSWQRLDENVRSRLVKEVKSGPQHYLNSSSSNKLSARTFKFEKPSEMGCEWRSVPEPFRQEDISHIEHSTLAINWLYPDAALKRAFAEWLSQQRKDRERRGLIEIKYKPKGRGGLRDKLRCLGALRVVNHYRTNQLVEYKLQDSKLKVAAPYRYSPDLYKNAKKARELVKMMSGDQ
jgi:hypothetical protein